MLFFLKMLLLLLFIGIVLSSKELCNVTSTEYFNTHTHHALFFIIATFDEKDPCTPISSEDFASLYPQYSDCVVDHIIDVVGSDDIYCGKYIMGNMLLVKKEWEMQMNDMCWADMKEEKIKVFGDLYGKALYNVKKCCKIGVLDYSSFVIIMVCVLIALCAFVFYIHHKYY